MIKLVLKYSFYKQKHLYKSQKNTTKQLKQQLKKFTVYAPFSGIIDDVFKEKGTVVAPGQQSELF